MTTTDQPTPRPPGRVQRQRSAGWRMPPFARYVGRPTRFGNPHKVGAPGNPTPEVAVTRFIRELQANRSGRRGSSVYPRDSVIRADLGGLDLACFCGPAVPCHVDPLLDIANSDPSVEPTGLDARRALAMPYPDRQVLPVAVHLGVTPDLPMMFGYLGVHWGHGGELNSWSLRVESDEYPVDEIGQGLRIRMGARSTLLITEGVGYATSVEYDHAAMGAPWMTTFIGSGPLTQADTPVEAAGGVL